MRAVTVALTCPGYGRHQSLHADAVGRDVTSGQRRLRGLGGGQPRFRLAHARFFDSGHGQFLLLLAPPAGQVRTETETENRQLISKIIRKKLRKNGIIEIIYPLLEDYFAILPYQYSAENKN